jgi:hypothetical protein
MKNIILSASLIIASCSYKSESEVKFEQAVLADCTTIRINRALMHLNSAYADRIITTGMLGGKITPEQQNELDHIAQKLDSLDAEIEKLKLKIYEKNRQR